MALFQTTINDFAIIPYVRMTRRGKYLKERAKETGRKGQKLDNFIYNGVILDGKMFVSGDNRDSYDSRYFSRRPRIVG